MSRLSSRTDPDDDDVVDVTSFSALDVVEIKKLLCHDCGVDLRARPWRVSPPQQPPAPPPTAVPAAEFGALLYSRYGCVQKVCTRKMTSLRRPSSCNTFVTNLEVQDTDFVDTPICDFNLQGFPLLHREFVFTASLTPMERTKLLCAVRPL